MVLPPPLRKNPMHRHSFLGLAAAFGLFAGSVQAQTPVTFTVDQAASAWNWSGTTSLGPLVGNPSNAFSINGTLDVVVSSGVDPISSGQILSGMTAVVPDLHARIPNPVVFLPDLATIDVTGLVLDFATTPFSVDAAGNFTTNITVTALSGTLTVAPLTGGTTNTNLTGTTGVPTPISGTIVRSVANIHFEAPQNTTFMFTDPGSGASGSFNLVGNLVGDYGCPPAVNYCIPAANSQGAGGAVMSFLGTTSIFENNLSLVAGPIDPGQPAIFYFGPNALLGAPFGDGFRCVGGTTTRILPPIVADGSGTLTRVLDHNAITTVIRSGERVNFQAWYRDPAGGPSGFNLSDGLGITFCP